MDIQLQKIQKQPLPVEKLDALGVAVVYLFGSQAEGVAGPASDIDIGVVFRDPSKAAGNISSLYSDLYDIFTSVFDMSNFRTIDIVFLQRVPLELRFDVTTHGIVLYEHSPQFRAEFEEQTAALYRDFKPLLNQFNHAVLERIL